MLTLAINTATSHSGIALLNYDGQSLATVLAEDTWKSDNNEAEKLMPVIDGVLGAANYTYDDLRQIAVLSGPGSFTGLRVGVTVGNTIAHLNTLPLYAIDTFQYFHAATDLPVLVFAGKGAVYFSQKESAPKILKLEEMNEFLLAEGISEVAGDISDEQIDLLDVEFTDLSEISFGETIGKILLNAELSPTKIINPNYIKAPSITISKKQIL